MSDGIWDWVKLRPDSWVKDVPEGQTTLEEFKEGFKKEMRSVKKKYVIKYLREKDWQELWGAQQVKQGIVENKEMKRELKELKSEGYSEPDALNKLIKEFVGKSYAVKTYVRQGTEIKGYSSNHINWTSSQERFISSRIEEPINNKQLSIEFNEKFKTNRSIYSIRDKKLRLSNKKK